MNKLDTMRRAQILSCLVEGNSIRATVRMTGAAKNTVVKLLAEVGLACAAYQDKTLRNLPCKRVDVDGYRCGHKARRRLDDWPARQWRRARLHVGSGRTAGQSRATHNGRPLRSTWKR